MDMQALLFDLDGTLVDSERENAEAMARALQHGQGIAIDEHDRAGVVGHSWVQIYDKISQRYPKLSWTRDELIAATFVCRIEVLSERGLTVLPGAHEVLQRFSAVPKAIVTGSSRAEMRHALQTMHVESHFVIALASEDVKRSKPAPDGYLLAAEKLAVPQRGCVVIEDSESGIAAGLAAGMTVIAVRQGNFSGHDQSAAHLQIDTLDELSEERIARAMVRAP